MPITAIDLATYSVRGRYHHSPLLRVCSAEPVLNQLPSSLRRVADEIWLRNANDTESFNPGSAQNGKQAHGIGYLVWFAGERLLTGTAAQLRATAAVAGRRSFFPVHYDADSPWMLLGLEARAWGPAREGEGGWTDHIDPKIRIAAAAAASDSTGAGEEAEPWQRLRQALRQTCTHPQAGIVALATLAQTPGLHPVLHALCLRNLVAALMRAGDAEGAGSLLQQARQAYPDYRELDYLRAQWHGERQQWPEAVAALQRATRPLKTEPALVGSGGESSYRAHTLLAHMAAAAGNQAVALQHYLTGLLAAPAYAPAVAGLLQQRVPASHWSALRQPLLRLGRQEARYQEAIFNFLLLHRDFEMARQALVVWRATAEQRLCREKRLAQLAPLEQTRPLAADEASGVVLQGPLLMHSSVAGINRALAAALEADPGVDLALEPTLAGEEAAAAFGADTAWAAGLRRLPHRLDLSIRHGWPPVFTPEPSGKRVLILPWEFGAIPQAWIEPLRHMDEIWTPSEFVRQVLVRAGVPEARVVTIPNGVDLETFQPEGGRERPEGARGTEFLFVGGAIGRKGMDVLLQAWREAFCADDDVSLVIKDMGARTFYRHLSLAQDIRAAATQPDTAPIVYLDGNLEARRLAALYRGCDVVVLPYRGEGFGLPLAEGLACGKPVIATAAGPAPEFIPRAAGWWVEAREVMVPERQRPPEAMSGDFTWFEPSVASLAGALHAAVYAGAAGREHRGAVGAQHIAAHYGWPAITARYLERVRALTN